MLMSCSLLYLRLLVCLASKLPNEPIEIPPDCIYEILIKVSRRAAGRHTCILIGISDCKLLIFGHKICTILNLLIGFMLRCCRSIVKHDFVFVYGYADRWKFLSVDISAKCYADANMQKMYLWFIMCMAEEGTHIVNSAKSDAIYKV